MQTKLALTAALLLALGGCKQVPAPAPDESASAPTPAPAESTPPPPAAPVADPGLLVELEPTQGNTTSGSLTLAPEGDGIRITGRVSGLEPNSTHGFHIHENGDCSAPDASSAGEHFNPGGEGHGRPGNGAHHAGDMLNIVAGPDGSARVSTWVQGANVGGGGTMDLTGKAIIVHADQDDYATPPEGNSGGRLACGEIE